MKLYFVRHGQTDWNVQSKVQGQSDIPLNEFGRNQAYETAQKLKDKQIDTIICSPLSRARETADIISKEINVSNIIYDSRILERNFGEFEGLITKEIDFEPIVSYSKNLFYEKAENMQLFYKRIHNFLDELVEKYKNTDKNILLVSHAGVSIAVACYFRGMVPDEKLRDYRLENCGVAEYEVN